MRRKFVLTILPVVLFSAAFAQTGIIRGTIIDAKTDEPLIGASVLVEGTTNGAAADLDGNYIIQNVPAGTYTLVVSYVAYNQVTREGVAVEGNQETVVDVEMASDDITLQEVEVVVRANRESENILLMEQRQALLATRSVGARELSRKGIGDARAAVAQVSGISRQEGVKNVFVRGLGDRYIATLLNGFPVPSEDPEYKNIALEFFGTDIIQNIGVNKVFNAGSYADVGGAVIDIHSKELVGDEAFGVDLSGGINSEAGRVDFYRPDGVDYWGFAGAKQPTGGTYDFQNSLDPLRVNTPVNQSFSLSGGKRFTLGENNNPLSFFAVTSHSTDYSYTEEIVRSITTGDEDPYKDQVGSKYSRNTNQLALANVTYDINRAHTLAYNFMMLHAMNEYVGDYVGKDAEKNQEPPYGAFLRRQQVNDNLLLVHQLLSNWTLSPRVKVDAGISYNQIKGSEPDRRENNLKLESDGSYSLMGSNRQKRFFSELKENDFNVKAALTYKLNDAFDNTRSSLVVGYQGRFVDDAFEAVEYNYDPYNPRPFHLDELRLDDVYNQASYDAGNFRMHSPITNTYGVSKYIHSGYAEGNWQLAARLTGNIGLRFDRVDMTVNYDVDHASPGKVALDKNYFLPSLNLRYDADDKNSLRLGASKTYTLPQSKEISPYRYVDIGFASQGNTDLKPSDNYNIDLKWDYYMSPSELLSVTGFYKYVANPIARVEVGNSAGVLYYDNISDFANVAGIELEARKNIFNRFNTGTEKINRLSVGLNASYIYTNLKVDVGGTTPVRNVQLEGASPFIGNIDVSYNMMRNEKNFLASLVFNYFSDRIHTIGMVGFKDIVEKGVGTLDVVSSYKFNTHFTVKLQASNLLDSSYRLTRERSGSDKVVTLNQFKKGVNVSVGVSYEL